MAWFAKSFSICILQGLNGKISQAFELSKGTFTQAIQSLYARWGDHLRLTASVPPAAFAAQNGRNPPLFLPPPSPKLQIHFLCITNIDRTLPGDPGSLSFQAGDSREAVLGSTARPAVPPWMHPTCLIPCAAPSSCTAALSRTPIQQLHFLVHWHCWMGTGAAGSQPQPLDLLKIGWNSFRPPRFLLFAAEGIPWTNYTSNNTKGGSYTCFTSKSVLWAHLGVEVWILTPKQGQASTGTEKRLRLMCCQHQVFRPSSGKSPEESTHSWKEFTKTDRWEEKEKSLQNTLPCHLPVFHARSH